MTSHQCFLPDTISFTGCFNAVPHNLNVFRNSLESKTEEMPGKKRQLNKMQRHVYRFLLPSLSLGETHHCWGGHEGLLGQKEPVKGHGRAHRSHLPPPGHCTQLLPFLTAVWLFFFPRLVLTLYILLHLLFASPTTQKKGYKYVWSWWFSSLLEKFILRWIW